MSQPPPASIELVADLRERVRRAGAQVADTRVRLWRVVGVSGFIGATAFLLAIGYLGRGADPPEIVGGLIVTALVVGLGLVLIFTPFLPTPALYRSVLRRRLRRAVAQLPPAQAAASLLPLCAEPSTDTGKLAVSLFRELRAPAELTPAGAPAGTGAELGSKGGG